MTLRRQIKNFVPRSIWNAGRDSWIAVRHASSWPLATFHPWRRASLQRLSELKDSHKGQRAFILGNGPSLARTDVAKLKIEQTFGMNRVYLAFPGWGFQTSFFVCVNDLVIEQFASDIAALPMPKFLSWRSRRFIKPDLQTIFLNSTYERPAFARDARGRLWEGATVTYIALQLAFHMGFDPVILIGIDHTYAAKGKPNTTVISEGNDASHFDPRYFGSGFRWQLPDLEMSEQAYRMAREAYESAGRTILDATVGGQLTVFPKAEYNSLF